MPVIREDFGHSCLLWLRVSRPYESALTIGAVLTLPDVLTADAHDSFRRFLLS
jgi:hypothetical protein